MLQSDALAEYERILPQQHVDLSGDPERMMVEANQQGDCATADPIDLASLQDPLRRTATLRDRKRPY
jgi:hypothetical protein